MRSPLALLAFLLLPTVTLAQAGNRLAYLDEVDPYYPHKSFPKLITPQWVGEDGVEAVVILAIDDMRDPKKYEAFLRPILRRLKEIDGRAPVSIMTNQVDPRDPQLQAWLKEGLSLECHTLDHPCPFFKNGFTKAKETFDRCVDLMSEIPNSKPVAFRMPCCDSLNTPSPRFYAEIFNKTTDRGKYLAIDSSVFNVFTANDPELPRDLVVLPDGSERFRRYLPKDRSFVNTIEDYPYPYVVGRLCWQFPCVTPSDWQAQHLHKPNNPQTVKDWQAALDCTVIKQGVMTMVFHPHGWITNDQLVELVDYADKKYGKKVKFLTFKEALERLEKNLLLGDSLRHPKNGGDNGVRLMQLGYLPYLDVLIGNDTFQGGWTMRPDGKRINLSGQWPRHQFVKTNADGKTQLDLGIRFGCDPTGDSFVLSAAPDGQVGQYKVVDIHKWGPTPQIGVGKPEYNLKLPNRADAVLVRDLDGDGTCEVITCSGETSEVFAWGRERWGKLPFGLPPGAVLSKSSDCDTGLRFIDLDGDGKLDIIFSNEKEYGVYLFKDMKEGWSRKVIAGKAGDPGAIPPIAVKGENMGCWVHSGHLWWSNEGTALLKDHVARVSFQELLKDIDPPAMTPEASFKALKPRPGFQAELMAAEPLVKSPVAFAFGPDGRLWVVEMGDYPLGMDGKGKPGGRVVVLEDTKGTGKYDKSTVFLDGLSYPTGVLPWKKGAIVISVPDIFYAEDTTGSGKADKKEVLYTGFPRGNPQHLVNGLVLGLDNWIYCANGDSGGVVTSVKTGKKVNLRGRDFRIKPDTGEIELQSGQTQYGRHRDDWNNWFGNNNTQPLWHYALDEHYLARNQFLGAPDPRVMVPKVPGSAQVYPIARILPRFNDFQAAGRFTSACSTMIYRDDLFGPAYAGNMFVCEPVHNLVHREIVKPKGLSFSSWRAADEQESEFLASADNWFRPTMLVTGPDGCLWVSDMYRLVIEHPEWIPKDWQAKLDLRAGENMGRMYRVFPVGAKPRPMPRLDKMSTAELVACLESPSGWQRDMAQLLLVQKKDAKAVALLEKLFRDSKSALARVHALYTLQGMGELHPEYVATALYDKHPGVRKHALRLIEPHMNAWSRPPAGFQKMTDDPDPQVRQQLAYTLGEWKDINEAGRMLAALAADAGDDPYMVAAIFSSVNKNNFAPTMRAILGGSKAPSALVMDRLVKLAGAFGDDQGTAGLLEAIGTAHGGEFTPAQTAALAGYLDALHQRNETLATVAARGPALKNAVKSLAGLFDAARKSLADPKASPEARLLALRLLGRGPDKEADDKKLLAGFLTPQTPDEMQHAAVATLGKLRGDDVPGLLLKGWKGYGPALRSAVLDTLLSRAEWVTPTLDALEKKTVLPAEVDAVRRQRLLDHKEGAVRERAAKLFAAPSNVDRQKLVESYRPALAMKGDATKGAEIFKNNCSACHQLGGIGQQVGPDLAPEAGKPGEVLLIAILDPNQAVEARYISYTATTKNGQIYTGLIASETGSSVTLVGADGKKHVLARNDIDELVSSGKSVMPEGLEKDIAIADMANLLAFLRKNAAVAKRKVFPGNTPAVVTANADGSLSLLANNCEIYGKTLVLENEYGNLGYWQSDDDRALWTVEVPKAGKYAVWIEWACDAGSAGNSFALDAGEKQLLTVKVASTRDWDTYKYARVGEVTLEAGRQTMVIRAAGKLQGAMIDLKAVKLVPAK